LFAALIVPSKRLSPVIWIAAIGIVVVTVAGLLIRDTHFDFGVVQSLNGLHTGVIASLTDGVYKFIGPVPAIIGTAVLTALILLITRSFGVASTFAVTIAGSWLSLAVVKLLVHRVRPDATLLSYPYNPVQVDASYPSGHAAFATAVVVTIFLGVTLVSRRWLVGVIGGLVILGVGTALVIDGVHYPSDVLGSIVWCIAVAPLVRFVWVVLVLRGIGSAISRRNTNARHRS
jgi:undecaprenyl-diphosphatase